jgi:hypothetical protein
MATVIFGKALLSTVPTSVFVTVDDLGPALRPLVGRRDLGAVLEGHQVGQGVLPRVGGGLGGGIAVARVAAGADLLDAELVEHVFVVVVPGGDEVGQLAGPLGELGRGRRRCEQAGD